MMSLGSGTEARVRVLLSMQRALLGAVTRPLRGVAVSWSGDRIVARFIYDEAPRDQDPMLEAETEVLADFDQSVVTDFRAEVAPAPMSLPLNNGEVWVYRRREG
jgi:hypothetical protein